MKRRREASASTQKVPAAQHGSTTSPPSGQLGALVPVQVPTEQVRPEHEGQALVVVSDGPHVPVIDDLGAFGAQLVERPLAVASVHDQARGGVDDNRDAQAVGGDVGFQGASVLGQSR